MTAERPRVTAIGVHVIDVLGRPIEELPGRGQVSQTIEEIRLTVAGTAGGTAVDLARLGAEVTAVGAIGDDHLGDFLIEVLEREGVAPRMARKPGTQTSATILPIHPDGSRPAWHVPGTNRKLAPEDVPVEVLAESAAVHYGGLTALPLLDGDPAAGLLRRAGDGGALVTADCLGVRRSDAVEVLTSCLPHVDVFMPNRTELLKITGTSDVGAAAQQMRKLGAGAVIVTCDADGCLVVDAEGERAMPAFEARVVDSTGCGDAFSAGAIVGLCKGWSLDRAALLGTAAATLTLGGLGSDAGIVSFEQTVAFMEDRARAKRDLEMA